MKTRLTVSRQRDTVKRVFADQESEPQDAVSLLLDISELFQEEVFSTKVKNSTTKPGWGLQPSERQFSQKAQRRIIRAGGAIDREGMATVLLTGTLPGSTEAAKSALARWSGYVTNRCNTWVRDVTDAHEAVRYSFGCWEWQKRGALHLHLAVSSKCERTLSALCDGFKTFWLGLLDDVCEKSGVDLWRKNDDFTHAKDKSVLQADAIRVTKSVAGYLSKYVGKGKNLEGSEDFYCPSRWWCCSRNCLDLIRKWTFEVLIETNPYIEASVVEHVTSLLAPTARKMSVFPRRYTSGFNVYFVMDRDKYSEVKDIVAQVSNRISSNLEAAVHSASVRTSVRAIARELYSDLQNRSDFMVALPRDCQSIIQGSIRINGINGLTLNSYALMAIYTGKTESELCWTQAIHLWKNGTLLQYLEDELACNDDCQELPNSLNF